jgi:hypothetical protein
MPTCEPVKRRWRKAIEQRVAVVFAASCESRMKVSWDFGNCSDRNPLAKCGVDTSLKSETRYRPPRFENAGLPKSVHTRVSPRGAENHILLARHRANGFLKMLLHRGAVVLTLPATEAGAVILDDELESALVVVRIRS